MRRTGIVTNLLFMAPAGITLAGSVVAPSPSLAQQPGTGTAPLAALCAVDATAGSTTERTVMLLAPLSDTSVSGVLRPLRRRDVDRLVSGVATPTLDSLHRNCRSAWRGPVIGAWYNSGTASNDRDGAVWQGRGLTVSATGGWVRTYGRFSVALRPLAVFTENRPFTPWNATGPTDSFRDPTDGNGIDLPFRFGSGMFAGIDPGESELRFSAGPASVGLSTASQQWGPAHFYPMVLGTEGAAFPRGFLEMRWPVARPVSLALHWLVGVLEASPYTIVPAEERSRAASAVTASIAPGAFPGLELGASRFFHVRHSGGLPNISVTTLPFTGLLKTGSNDTEVGGFNQLASIFFRVAPRGSGVEAYGELYREDHSANLRDVIGEPDHSSAYVLGLRRTWKNGAEYRLLTIERANGRVSHLVRVRTQGPPYIHDAIKEGHAYRGQPLGSVALLRGGGLLVAWSRVATRITWDASAEVTPVAQNGEGGTWNGAIANVIGARLGRSWMSSGSVYRASAEVRVRAGHGPGGSNVTVALGRAW